MTSQNPEKTDTVPGTNGAPKPIWLFALGALMIGLGILALSYPMVSTLAVELTLGILLGIAGVATLVHAFLGQRMDRLYLADPDRRRLPVRGGDLFP